MLCGRPNVGKSSIFNALLGENRVIVSPVSGTTRDSVEESLLLGGLRLRLVDTAGLGHGGAELEEEGRARARERLGQADLCLLVLDVSQPLTPQDWQVLEETRDRPRLILANKSDLAPAWSLKGAGLAGVEVSARGGQGLAALEQALVQALTGGEPEPQAGQWAVNARQGQGLARCLEAVEAAQAHLKDQAWELVSLELGQALASLGQVDGQDAPDQVLETVFAKFCLGK